MGVATMVVESRPQSLEEHLSSHACSEASACCMTIGRSTVVNISGMAGLAKAAGPIRDDGMSCLNSSCLFSQRNWKRAGFVVMIVEFE